MKKVFRLAAAIAICGLTLTFGACSNPSSGNATNVPSGDSSNSSDKTNLTFEVGDVVTINGVPEGIVFYVYEADKSQGKMLSLERYRCQFCGLYTKACEMQYANQLVNQSWKINGEKNYEIWSSILPDFSGSSYYNAWYWCKHVKGLDWYIPAIGETTEICNNITKINNATARLNAKGYVCAYFDEIWTWSSTPRGLVSGSSQPTISLWYGKGTASMICNETKFYVHPVRGFTKKIAGIGKLSL
ncbi:MAG: hypothetical protein IJL24_01750 [Treponema sp.]|nr:hypothetical protein [Treponema sp.]